MYTAWEMTSGWAWGQVARCIAMMWCRLLPPLVILLVRPPPSWPLSVKALRLHAQGDLRITCNAAMC